MCHPEHVYNVYNRAVEVLSASPHCLPRPCRGWSGGGGGIDCADLRADIAHRTAHTRYLDIYTGLQGTGLPNYFVNIATRIQEGVAGAGVFMMPVSTSYQIIAGVLGWRWQCVDKMDYDGAES